MCCILINIIKIIPCPRGHGIYNFARPFLDDHYCIPSLSDQCLGVEKKIFLNNHAFSLYDLYGPVLAQDPCPEDNKIYNIGGPFLGHHYCILSLSDLCPRIEKKNFKVLDQFCI